jgi:hypothetical protein
VSISKAMSESKNLIWIDFTEGTKLEIIGLIPNNEFDGYLINNEIGKMTLTIITDNGATSNDTAISSRLDGVEIAEKHFIDNQTKETT